MKSDPEPGALPRRRIRTPVRFAGQGVVEFGLIIVILCLIIGAGIDVGLMVTVRQNVSVATGEAARQLAYGAPVADIVQAARKAVTGTLASPSGLAVVVKFCDQNGANCNTYCDGFLTQLYGQLYTDPVQPPQPQPCPAPPPRTTSPRLEQPGDWGTVTLWEEKYEILTPWLRMWGKTQDDLCQTANQPCYLRLTMSQSVRYPGPSFP